MTPPGFRRSDLPPKRDPGIEENLRWVQEKGQKMSRKRYKPEQVIVMHRETLR
jgi:hypothetical protein